MPQDDLTKARKRHTCKLCDGWIEVGERHHVYQCTPWDGINDQFYTWRSHEKCQDFASMWDDNDEGQTGDWFIATLEGVYGPCIYRVLENFTREDGRGCIMDYLPPFEH